MTMDVVLKTQFGINSERKLVTAKSIDQMEHITGIPREEMFGTTEGNEKVLIIGAPEQAKNVADETRFTYIDYEFADIANFVHSYHQLIPTIGTPLYEYDYHRPSAQDNMKELGFLNDDGSIKLKPDNDTIPYYEGGWCSDVYTSAVAIMDNVISLNPDRKDQDDTRSESEIRKQIDSQLNELKSKLIDREQNDAETIEKRKQIDKESDGAAFGFYGHHPIEELHTNLWSFVNRTEHGLKDVDDFNTIVIPRLNSFRDKLITDKPTIPEDELDKSLAKEKLSILNELRLKKKTKEAGVAVSIFPELPFADKSFDRLVFSYSISTHVIAEMTDIDFQSWWDEIQRVLTVGGKAYIFPMQQGFPYGRTYNGQACFSTLDQLSPQNNGHLEYETISHSHDKEEGTDFVEETLVITKV